MTMPTDADPTDQGGVVALGDDTIAALQTALAAEHAALWMYGRVASLAPDMSDTVSAAIISHQGSRDSAANLIVTGGGTPVGPQPAYTAPDDTADAAQLALVIEEDCAAAWRAVTGFTDDAALRGTALATLTECALRMVSWRRTAKEKVLTEPFPGKPQTA